MNYLAHLYLSGNDEGLTVGNFIADSVKGDDHKNYPPDIQKGILLHRKIDEFTDHHPIVHQSKQYFVKEFDKYSGVLIDIFYDHFLAKNFSDYSGIPLKEYAASRYELLKKYYDLFPEKGKAFYGYMTGNNILVAYANVKGIERVLQGVTNRIGNRVLLYESMSGLNKNYEAIEREFNAFFMEIQKYIRNIP